jgi:hypothetical protein
LYQPLLSGGRSNVMLSIEGEPESYLTPTPALAELPALSVQLAVADPPPIVPDVHEAIPERLSVPEALKSTGWLYQSPESGPRDKEMPTEGGVASYLIGPKLVGALVLPALSVHVPENDALVPSGPPYVVELQPAIPEVASVPLKLMPTGWLYQPFASGGRLGDPPVTLGAFASRLTVITGVLYEPPVL